MSALGLLRNGRRMVLALALAAGTAISSSAVMAALINDSVPPADRKAIEDVLQARVAGLQVGKNSDGVPFKRGTWSKA